MLKKYIRAPYIRGGLYEGLYCIIKGDTKVRVEEKDLRHVYTGHHM